MRRNIYRQDMDRISNSEIRLIRSLSQKKFRDEYGLFTVEGEKMVSEAQSSGFAVEKIFRRDEIGETAMSKISAQSSPSPVLAVVRKPENTEISDTGKIREMYGKGLFLALDSIRDPGNLGTILRISDWFGVDAVFASPDTVDVFNPKVVQSTMGAIFRVKFHYIDIPSVLDTAKAGGGKIYGTFLDGDNIYGRDLDCGDSTPSVIVIGNESAGISAETAAKCTDRLYIPPYPEDCPGSESLNAAVATAVTLSEFRRRQFKSPKI